MTANNNELKNNFSLNQGCGRLIIKGDFNFHTIEKGWKSSLAYGVVLSSLSRAYYLTNKDQQYYNFYHLIWLADKFLRLNFEQ